MYIITSENKNISNNTNEYIVNSGICKNYYTTIIYNKNYYENIIYNNINNQINNINTINGMMGRYFKYNTNAIKDFLKYNTNKYYNKEIKRIKNISNKCFASITKK